MQVAGRSRVPGDPHRRGSPGRPDPPAQHRPAGGFGAPQWTRTQTPNPIAGHGRARDFLRTRHPRRKKSRRAFSANPVYPPRGIEFGAPYR